MKILNKSGEWTKRPGASLTVGINREPRCEGFQEGDQLYMEDGRRFAVIHDGRPWLKDLEPPESAIARFLADEERDA